MAWYADRGSLAITRHGCVVDVVEVDTTNPQRTYLVRTMQPCTTYSEDLEWIPCFDLAEQVAPKIHDQR